MGAVDVMPFADFEVPHCKLTISPSFPIVGIGFELQKSPISFLKQYELALQDFVPHPHLSLFIVTPSEKPHTGQISREPSAHA